MAFWDDLIRNIGQGIGGAVNGVESFFGGGQKKKPDNQNNFSTPAPRPTAPTQQQQAPQINTQSPQNLFHGLNNDLRLPGAPNNNLTLPGSQPNQPPQPPKPAPEQQLDTLTNKNLPAAQQQVQKGEGIMGHVINFFTHNDDNTARQIARNKAVNEFQDNNNWTPNPSVANFQKRTVQMGDQNSNAIKTQNDTITNAIKTSSQIPVLSDFTTMGSAGATGLFHALGDKTDENAANNNYSEATLGMSDAEIAKLPKEQQDRLRQLQTGLTVASPIMGGLDIGSLGTAGEALGALKTAAVQDGKDELIQAGKTGAKNMAKNAIIASGAAPVISAPIENYVRNGNALNFDGFDPSSIPRTSAQAALWSLLLPGAADKPAAEDINNAKVNVADEAARAAEDAAGGTGTKIQVQQPRDIPVTDGSPEPTTVPVTNNSTPQSPIVDVKGDTPGVNQIKVPTPDEAAAARFASQPKSNPDHSIDGVITNPDKVITQSDKAEAQATIDDLKNTGKITDEQHKQLTSQLEKIQAQDQPAPKGQKIDVKEVKSIPVTDQTTVPTNLPETPGNVRVTDATAPNSVKTQEAANAPIVATPVELPKDVQAVLDNPKQFNSRQVAAARNQRKLARQMAKTQEQTAEAVDRIQTASPAAQSGEGFVPTGEFAKSQNGGAYQKANRTAEMQQAVSETANMSPGDAIKTARENQAATGGFNRRDIRNIAALFEQKRIPRGTPEFNEAKQILKEDGTVWGQTGALRNYTMRRTASSDELVSRFESKIYKMADDPSKIDSKLFDQVDAAETKFTDTRDAATEAHNRYTEAPTPENAKAYHAAKDAADAADKEAKLTEYKVASQALKGNKDVQQMRELEKMAQSADMYQMDSVDASMLSGTGTFARNLVNAAIGGTEEGLFGKVAAKVASLTPKARANDISVGGGVGHDSFSGLKEGAKNIVDASKARASEAGANPLEHIKNWATTGNQLGDAFIDSQTKHDVLDHYTQQLKSEGYTGQELTDRASIMAREDPTNVTHIYQNAARVAAGLGSGITRNNKIETFVKNMISDGISGGNPNKYTENVAKLVTRMTIGFPTAIGRSLIEGSKRFTLGAPTFIKALMTEDPQQRAVLVKEGIKQAGTGTMVIPPLFYALGSSGAITGAYPSGNSAEAKAEQAQWQRDGVSENSIKIGDSYFQLPAYLGSWALPALFYASLGRNGGDWGAAAADTAKIVPSILPTEQMSNISDVINGKTDFSKFMSQTGASAIRAMTPGGALLNQLAKSFDPTQNDTNGGDAFENLISKVMSGIPGLSNTLPDKTDDTGNVLHNPNPLALAFGAASASQQSGVDHSNQLQGQADNAVKSMSDAGAFSDPNIKAILPDDATKKIYDEITAGKQVKPTELKSLQEAMVKGVSATGDDTAYLEKGQYDTNLTTLQLKRNLMAADPTTKPSDLTKMDTAIKRGQVYKDNQIPYDMIHAYETTSLTDWRDMGNPKNDNYDPDMYQKLWTIDDLMTKAGVSYGKKEGTKQKYSAKASGSGGRGGSRGFGADFGTLKAGLSAPNVQQYQTIAHASGSVPAISIQRPNIVHKISSSG